jgi:hypothetical protein
MSDTQPQNVMRRCRRSRSRPYHLLPKAGLNN